MALLRMEHIDKVFWGKYANQDVHLAVEPGEIHALLGENGAGKTTLMNILYGIYQRDGGELYWKEQSVSFRSPKDAIEKNIGMVHQHFMLVPTLTASENITLGLKEKGYPFTDRAAIDKRIKEISEKYGLHVDPAARIAGLSVGEQQRVEIMKLLYRRAELLILDEPTAVLTPQETKRFFEVLKRLRADGCSVILITHRISEVLETADMVTVLRDTKSVLTAPISELNETTLSEHMIGRQLSAPAIRTQTAFPGDGLQLNTIAAGGKGAKALQELSLTVRPGEVLGIAGVDGNGQKSLAEAILGIRKTTAGTITLFGEDITSLSVATRKQKGIAYISDDRHKDGLVLDMNLIDNMLLKYQSDKRYQRHGFLNMQFASEAVAEQVENYSIKAHALTTPIRYLSGGNQQKLILARELCDAPKVVVAFQPTRGLDIGAAEFVQQQLLLHRQRGACILLISADLEEIRALSDRVAVIHNGRIMGILENDDHMDMTKIGLMMAGIKAQEGEVCNL